MKKHLYKIPSSIPFTQAGYTAVIEEQEKLLSERPDAVTQLKRAREMGDLKENGFYRGARFKLSAIDRRLRELNHLIRYGKIIKGQTNQTVTIGSQVVVNSNDTLQEYCIVGEYEANPSEHKISHKSPLGKKLLGKKAGEHVVIETPSGSSLYILLEIQ